MAYKRNRPLTGAASFINVKIVILTGVCETPPRY